MGKKYCEPNLFLQVCSINNLYFTKHTTIISGQLSLVEFVLIHLEVSSTDLKINQIFFLDI